MSLIKKDTIFKSIIGMGYVVLFIPFLYAIFYSMPANDDYAWALEWWSDNRLIEMINRIDWNYNNYFGQSGVVAIAFQVLLNPLYWFDNKGHSFGISMVIINVVIFVTIIMAIRKLFEYLFGISNKKQLAGISLLITALLTTSYYYADVYNWWSGIPGYSGMMAICLCTFVAIAKYYKIEKNNKNYIMLVVLGIITCTSMMYCVALGSFYLIVAMITEKDNGDSFKKKVLPLILYIISGLITVIAPGNKVRMGEEMHADSSIIQAVYVTAYKIIKRSIMSIYTRPWIIAIIMVIVLIGLLVESKYKTQISIIIISTIAVFASSYMALFLYVFGSSKTIDSEIVTRIYYVVDYMLFIGTSIIAFEVGAWIGQRRNKSDYRRIKTGLLLGAIGVVLIAFATGRYKNNIQIDIVSKTDIIKASWAYWDDILDEIEKAEPESNVVVKKESLDWNPYSYYVSLDDIPRNPLSGNSKYGNCNQCASKYYGVNSIVVYIQEE